MYIPMRTVQKTGRHGLSIYNQCEKTDENYKSITRLIWTAYGISYIYRVTITYATTTEGRINQEGYVEDIFVRMLSMVVVMKGHEEDQSWNHFGIASRTKFSLQTARRRFSSQHLLQTRGSGAGTTTGVMAMPLSSTISDVGKVEEEDKGMKALSIFSSKEESGRVAILCSSRSIHVFHGRVASGARRLRQSSSSRARHSAGGEQKTKAG